MASCPLKRADHVDGMNLKHLVFPESILDLPAFLQLYHEQHFVTSAIAPGFPPETTSRSLAMWISWLVSCIPTSTLPSNGSESEAQRDERLFVLRPYVFASHYYDVHLAPWTMLKLPCEAVMQDAPSNPFVADLSPKSRKTEIEYFGRRLELSPPVLAQAAILRFFVKGHGVDRDDIEMDNTPAAVNGEIATPPFLALANGTGPAAHPYMDIDDDDSDNEGVPFPRGMTLVKSSQHDRDFERMRYCFNPSISRGLRPPAWRGSWAGSWEGNFSFFDFDAFKAVLSGHSRALYEGPFGEQAQVWRLRETYIRPRKGRPAFIDASKLTPAPVADPPQPLKREAKGKGKSRTSAAPPLKGPMTNAGFPAAPSWPDRSLATPSAEEATVLETLKRQVNAYEGYEMIPEDELDEALSTDDPGLEMLLTGTGHSAWGRFILRGRVRPWDGMASLVKEYAVRYRFINS